MTTHPAELQRSSINQVARPFTKILSLLEQHEPTKTRHTELDARMAFSA